MYFVYRRAYTMEGNGSAAQEARRAEVQTVHAENTPLYNFLMSCNSSGG